MEAHLEYYLSMNAEVELSIDDNDFYILSYLQKKAKRQYFIFRKLLLINDFKLLVENVRYTLDKDKLSLKKIRGKDSEIMSHLKKGYVLNIFGIRSAFHLKKMLIH